MRLVQAKVLLTLLTVVSCFTHVQARRRTSKSSLDDQEHTVATKNETTTAYGLDVSFPIHHRVSTNYPDLPHNTNSSIVTPYRFKDAPLQPLGDRQHFYLQHLDNCRRAYPKSRWCDQFEFDRMLMNRRQPQSMKNYTKTGFRKIRAPEHIVELVGDFWNKNHYKAKPEVWPEGNTYINHWDSPTYLVSVDDKGLRGSGAKLKEEIWAAAAATLESWTSQELQPVSLYGVRVYGEGTIMLPHVDRLPLVVSAMLCVASDLDEPWPFELYDHSGHAHNVTLEPGDMLLFESHSVIHGHPFPLKGRYYAMIFLHFEPTGHTLELSDESGYHRANNEYRTSVKDSIGGQSSATKGSLPPYITRASPEEENWKKAHPQGWMPPFETLPSEAHAAAKEGDVRLLLQELGQDSKILTERDENGWQLLHQGVAGGNQAVVELLVSHGADINSRTHGGYGETPLRIAEKRHGESHSIVRFLKSVGALSLGPEL